MSAAAKDFVIEAIDSVTCGTSLPEREKAFSGWRGYVTNLSEHNVFFLIVDAFIQSGSDKAEKLIRDEIQHWTIVHTKRIAVAAPETAGDESRSTNPEDLYFLLATNAKVIFNTLVKPKISKDRYEFLERKFHQPNHS